jgi:hypothetical protein
VHELKDQGCSSHLGLTRAKIAATIAATPCAVLIEPIMPAGPRMLELRAIQERPLAGCPAGRDVVDDAVLGGAIAKSNSQHHPELMRCGLHRGGDLLNPEVLGS